MLAGLAFGSEIKRFGRSRLTRAAIVVLALLPLVYGALYLWAYWDPFGHVNKMPVALVNADRGAVVSGQRINVGDEIAKSLTQDGGLEWHVMSHEQARGGVDHGKYYFMLELPPDFSEAVASPVTGQSKKAELIAVYNDANNYISSNIGRTAVDQVLTAVSTRISGQAVNQVLSVVLSSGSGIKQAADGARLLADGAAQVDDGAAQLSAAIDKATDPILAVGKAASAVGGDTEQLQQAAVALRQANAQIGGIAKAQDGAAASLAGVIDQLSASDDPAARSSAETLRGVQNQLHEHQFTPQIRQQLTDGENAAISLTETLRSPGSPLRSALDQLGGKGRDLTDKLAQLRAGAERLKSGTAQVRGGSSELAAKLADGAGQVPNWTPQQKDAIADTIGGPVHLRASHLNAAPNFGTGMAPFFLTLALFFGAIVLWMVFRPLQNRAIAAQAPAFRVALASYLPAALIGISQAVVLYCVVRFGLGMRAAHPVAMLAFMALVSFAFVALTQSVNALLGPAVGRVLVMALLMVQLVSAGGMYPVETTSKPFQALHRYDPMTYGVNGLRQLVLGGVDSRLWQAVLTLAAIMAGALAVSSVCARRNRLWNASRLIPAIKM
ncbi:YhgE/Pip C-terminal domain protein [Segniliparus rotundus DSM 44985]|uniref:YhgE/Pip C-terminal domain protein n=1 Tax=Segniliparus rotundus (strain ATCC BAA-972 / CDC 1076 / CIP 108378 / DSM 44985 / JCM 13578) TaxID=640132 RepID=D6ZB32_SEGRD|nr:YhgE/Pip domain-containing protein [Segniliparus rotundus]ADG96791.1 YhgE/Pip C-terminal domain protein [Segniliparus rotundus DSM 44985]